MTDDLEKLRKVAHDSVHARDCTATKAALSRGDRARGKAMTVFNDDHALVLRIIERAAMAEDALRSGWSWGQYKWAIDHPDEVPSAHREVP